MKPVLTENPFWWMADKNKAREEKAQQGYTTASRNGYYESTFWSERRAQKLRQNPFCEQCEKNGLIRAASVVDHKKPIPANASFSDFVALSEIIHLQSLDKKCHRSKTAHDRHKTKMPNADDIKTNMKRFEE